MTTKLDSLSFYEGIGESMTHSVCACPHSTLLISQQLKHICKYQLRPLVWSAICVLLISVAHSNGHAQTQNPIAPALAADPYIITQGGQYYFMATHSADVQIKTASSIDGLADAPWVSVYTPAYFPQSLGLWYFPQYNSSQPWFIIYQETGNSGGVSQVLQSNSTDPMGAYTLVNSDICNGSCGDPGYLQWNGNLYLISTDLSTIYLTPLSDPATSSGSRSGIIFKRPAPSDYSTDWEWNTNDSNGCCIEGAFPWIHNGQLSMTFSGNRYQTNYYATGISQFTGGTTGDPTAAANWQELDTASAQWFGGLNGTTNGVWGAAAVRGFTAPGDSNEVWVVYHAYPQYCDFCTDDREAYVQPQTWSSNNLPTFNGGVPLGNQSVQLPAGDPGAASFSGCYTLHNESTGNELWQTGNVYNSVAGVYYLVDVPGGWAGNYAVWRLTLQSNGYYTVTSEGQDGQLWITADSYGGPGSGYLYVVTVPTAWTGDYRYWSLESSGDGNNYLVSKSNPTLELQETGNTYDGQATCFTLRPHPHHGMRPIRGSP